MPGTRAWSVAELVSLARDRLETGFTEVWVEGEISNHKLAPSGHHYFVLKDASAQLRAVLWKNRGLALRFRPGDGLSVLARGTLTVYPARGDLQLSVSALEPVGAGELALAFEQLKARLQTEGLFAPERKRPLPLRPRRIGIVTSASGAALRDMLQVLGRRHPSIPVLIAPARVQGAGAALEIAAALARLNQEPDIDVVIVGRGGGSLEDLWAFNEEVLARAIAASRVPVISAVGHETDVTIADFVADFRAPTPSAAAETVVLSELELGARIEALRESMRSALDAHIARLRGRLLLAARARSLGKVQELPRRLAQRLDELEGRLAAGIRRRSERVRARLASAAGRLELLDVRTRLVSDRRRLADLLALLQARVHAQLSTKRARLGADVAQLEALSPLAVLNRGYAIARNARGQLLRRSQEVEPGDSIHLILAEGGLLCRVEERKP